VASGWVEQHLALIRERHGARITLDAIGELVGDQRVSVQEIESLLDEIEAGGVHVDASEDQDLPRLLTLVLQTARDLRLDALPVSPTSIATRSGLTSREVRVALLFAEVLQR
jgi:hypothetical protein